MAKEKDDIDALEGDEEVKPKSKKKLFIILGAVAGVLLLSGVAGFLLLPGDDDAVLTDEVLAVEEDAGIKEALYHELYKPIVVNYRDISGRSRFLQVRVVILSRNKHSYESVKHNSPLLKSNLIVLFSGEEYEDLTTYEGKVGLATKALDEVNRLLEQVDDKARAEAVFFTDFVMQ